MQQTTEEVFKKIRRIQIQTTRLATDLLAGSYRSAFKGKGIEFEEVREFQEGDEVRHIDWNVTARMNHPFVKTFREERELSVMVICDASASCRFGGKNELMAEIGGVLAFSAIKNQDNIGLILYTDRVEKYIPPRKGVRHVLRLIRELLLFEPKGQGTDLGQALRFFGNVQKQAGICFILSDFIEAKISSEIKLLSKKHDLIAIHLIDPREQTLPRVGLLELQDLETGEIKVVNSNDPRVQRHLHHVFLERKHALKTIVNQTGIGLIEVHTDQPFMPSLRQFFKWREVRR